MSARPPARSVDTRPRAVARAGPPPRSIGRPGIGAALAAWAVEDRPLHRRPARLADRDRGPAPVARLPRPRPCTCPGGRPSTTDRCICRRATARAAGSATWSAGVHGHSRSANRDSAAKSVPIPATTVWSSSTSATGVDPRAPAAQDLVSVDGLGQHVRPEVADERVLVPGPHDVEHAEVVPDRGPVGVASTARTFGDAPPLPASPSARPASSRPSAGACAACGRRRTGSAGACRRRRSPARSGPPGRPSRPTASAGPTA